MIPCEICGNTYRFNWETGLCFRCEPLNAACAFAFFVGLYEAAYLKSLDDADEAWNSGVAAGQGYGT